MTTFEITVTDESKLDLIVSLLKEFRYISIGNVQTETTKSVQKTSKKAETNWTDAKLDPITHALVLESIEQYKKGDKSQVIQVNDIKEIFYDL